MAELLLELFSEEIPARMQKRAADDFNKLIIYKLNKANLVFSNTKCFVTPRRIALVVDGLPERQADLREERKGPRVDASEKAVLGFLKAVGLERDEVEERTSEKGTFLFAAKEKKGAQTKTILPNLIRQAIQELAWQKSMRWSNNSFRWVRPLHHVLAVFNNITLKGSVPLGVRDLEFTNVTYGHRFLSPGQILVSNFSEYETKLRNAYVVISSEERKQIIAENASKLASELGLSLRKDIGLLEEVNGLVEWPVPLLGKIDPAFLHVPSECLVSAMRTHQKYFSMETSKGTLAPYFVVVSNMASDPDRDSTIVSGNEKVLRARLSDAKFYWEKDLSQTMESRIVKLNNITFYEKLGSLGEKTTRIEKLAERLAEFIPNCPANEAKSAARLAKADLTSEMVGEFPELQGVMGRYYAQNDGNPTAICNAIAEHYAPQGPSDSCPKAPVSIAVSMADKLDTLVGFFAVGDRPTGSKDPFGLRRAALGLCRLIVENDLRLPLNDAISFAHGRYKGLDFPNGLMEFMGERLKIHLRDQGIRQDLIIAISALGQEDDLNRLISRVKALETFVETDDGANLLVAHGRAANIVRIESKKDGRNYYGEVNLNYFEMDEERSLQKALEKVKLELSSSIGVEDFTGAMSALSKLRAPVDLYFDKVTVNVERPVLRENRLKTLASIVTTMYQIADFSKVQAISI